MKKTLFFLLTILILTTNLLQSAILLKEIRNDSNKTVTVICDGEILNITPKNHYLSSVIIENFTKDLPIIIDIANNINEIYYGESIAKQPCICIKLSNGKILRNSMFNPEDKPNIALIVSDCVIPIKLLKLEKL